MSYLRYMCLFTYIVLVVPTHIVFGFFCLRLVCPMLMVSLDCPFLISPSVFSNVYLQISILFSHLFCSLGKRNFVINNIKN
jgi:hypothetical protein